MAASRLSLAVFDLDGDTVRASTLAVFLLRKLLLSQLTSDPTWSIQDLDDELLRSLTRGITTPAASPPVEALADNSDEEQQLPAARCPASHRQVTCFIGGHL